jgi:hypothetical protein
MCSGCWKSLSLVHVHLLKDVAVDDPWYFSSQHCSLPFVYTQSSNHLSHCVNSSATWGPQTFKTMFVSSLFKPKSWIPRRKLSSGVSLNLLVYSSWWCEVNHNFWQRFWYTWMNKEVPPYLQLCRRGDSKIKKFSCCMIQVCFYESPIFKECLIIVSNAMQLLSTSSLHIFFCQARNPCLPNL